MTDSLKTFSNSDLKKITGVKSSRNPSLPKGMLGNLIILIEEFMEFRNENNLLREDIKDIKKLLERIAEKEKK